MKKLLFIFMLIITISLVGCSNDIHVGYGGASSGLPFSGFLGITSPKESPIDEAIEILFEYGHDSHDVEWADMVYKTVLRVYVVFKSDDPFEPEFHEDVELYNLELTDFYTEENRCNIKSFTLFSRDIEFNSCFTLEIDFDELGFSAGIIIYEILEYSEIVAEPEGYLKIEENVHFKVEDEIVNFY
ncbi:hypothetical protein RJI07_06120 [Mycoplasmatota bacterium WC30]